MAQQALYGKRGFCDAMVCLVKRGSPKQRIKALECLRPLFAEHAELATEKRDRSLFFKANFADPAESAIDVIFKAAFADTRATPAVRAAAMKTIGVINDNLPEDEEVSMTGVLLEAQRAQDAAKARKPVKQPKFRLG